MCSDPACLAAVGKHGGVGVRHAAQQPPNGAADQAAQVAQVDKATESSDHNSSALSPSAAQRSALQLRQQTLPKLSRCEFDLGTLQSLDGTVANAGAPHTQQHSAVLAAAAFFGTVWVVSDTGRLVIQRDDGVEMCRCHVDLLHASKQAPGLRLCAATIATNAADPAVAAVSMAVNAGAAAQAAEPVVLIVRLLEQPLDGGASASSAASAAAAISRVQLPAAAAGSTAASPAAALLPPAVAWDAHSNVLLIGTGERALLTADAASGATTVVARQRAVLPASLGSIHAAAVIAGPGGSLALLVSTHSHLLIATSCDAAPNAPAGAGLLGMLERYAQEPSLWAKAAVFAPGHDRIADPGHGQACPFLRVAGDSRTAHVAVRIDRGRLCTFDLDVSDPARFTSWRELYVRKSLRYINLPCEADICDVAVLPWRVLVATVATSGSSNNSSASTAQLHTFSRADGAPVGRPVDAPAALAASGHALHLAVDVEDPHTDTSCTIGALAVSADALARIDAPADAEAAAAALVAARRFGAARRLLQSSSAGPRGCRGGWLALAGALLQDGRYVSAAEALAHASVLDDADGGAESSGVTFQEAALALAGQSMACEAHLQTNRVCDLPLSHGCGHLCTSTFLCHESFVVIIVAPMMHVRGSAT